MKYEIGQEVWLLYNNKVRELSITAILENKYYFEPLWRYDGTIKIKVDDLFDESEIFPSKEELLKSL